MVILAATPGVLFFGPAMRHCEVLRVTAGSDVENLPLLEMAQLTWPMQAMRPRPGETGPPQSTVTQVVRMGKEHDLVTLISDEHKRNSVRINVALCIYSAGQWDALDTGQLTHRLSFALPEVDRVNRG